MTEPWLSAYEVLTRLGVRTETVRAWSADEGAPAHKGGEADEWVRRNVAARAGA